MREIFHGAASTLSPRGGGTQRRGRLDLVCPSGRAAQPHEVQGGTKVREAVEDRIQRRAIVRRCTKRDGYHLRHDLAHSPSVCRFSARGTGCTSPRDLVAVEGGGGWGGGTEL